MIELNVPNIVTIGLISVGGWVIFQMAMAKFMPSAA